MIAIRGATRRCTELVCALALAPACGDEVVGFFDTGGADTSADVTSTGAPATTSGTITPGTDDGADTTTAQGDSGFMAPGCFHDDFENGVVDDLWNTWTEEDSALEEIAGMLKMTPPSFGIWDTGVVGAYNYVFPFTDGHVRMRVPIPPAAERPVLLFLTIGEEGGYNVSMQLTAGMVVATASLDLEQSFHEEFPMASYPGWIGMRSEGDLVHFEVSDDGITYTPLTSTVRQGAFEVSSALIMAQTFDPDTDRSAVAVDDVEVCVQ